MNRREQLTLELREDMGSAILELMKEKPLEKITVDELTQKANVGRVTFYRQFRSKEEAIAWKLQREWIRFAAKHHLDFETTEPKKYAKGFFKFIYSIRETNALLIENDCRSCIFNAMRYSFKNLEESADIEEYYHDHFRAYGLLGLVDGWIDSGYDLSQDAMADLAVKYFYV